MEVSFEGLQGADLVVDTVYKGGKISGKGSEVLSKLLPNCSNSGGFRKVMRKDGSGMPAYVVLYSSMQELAWPDYLDEETVKETIGVGVNEKAALSSDKNCPFVYINFDFTLVNKVASL